VTTTEAAKPLRKIKGIGPAIDDLFTLRQRKQELEKQIKDIESEYSEIEDALLAKLKAEGTDKGAGKRASVSVSTTTVGNLVDADKFFAYVKKTGYFHLMQRRLSDPAIRELMASKGSIPGVTTFDKVRLNLRVLSGA
jgi:hypothetical protein